MPHFLTACAGIGFVDRIDHAREIIPEDTFILLVSGVYEDFAAIPLDPMVAGTDGAKTIPNFPDRRLTEIVTQ